MESANPNKSKKRTMKMRMTTMRKTKKVAKKNKTKKKALQKKSHINKSIRKSQAKVSIHHDFIQILTFIFYLAKLDEAEQFFNKDRENESSHSINNYKDQNSDEYQKDDQNYDEEDDY